MMKKQFKYIKGEKKYIFGKTNRMPAEMLLVKQINEIIEDYPGYRMVLPGTSGIHGETFPLFNTMVMFKLTDQKAADLCLAALRERDNINRNRRELLWNWVIVFQKETNILFFVNWLDFAWFISMKDAFLGQKHAEYTKNFGLNPQDIKHQHYRILEDGTKIKFDENSLSEEEKEVVANIDKIPFDRSLK